jgi:hypothetical protein
MRTLRVSSLSSPEPSRAGSAAEALQAPGKLPEFFAKTDDILLRYLDALHGAEMDSNNHKIYLELTQKFERRFFEDMNVLNVLPPDELTRVTEYVPRIVRFVEKIVANGFGYATSDGSVYFDIDSFEKAGHSYSRLEPWSIYIGFRELLGPKQEITPPDTSIHCLDTAQHRMIRSGTEACSVLLSEQKEPEEIL